MKVIHVLRKPCSEPTVAANVLRHGTGALNIDATRIGANALPTPCKGTGWAAQDKKNAEQGYRPTAYYDGQNGVFYLPNNLGRWPANLVLQHLPTCEHIGERRVAGNGARVSSLGKGREGNHTNGIYGAKASKVTTAYVSEDGTKTVAAWTCAEGCPVAALDAQSGVTKDGVAVRHNGVSGGSGTSIVRAKPVGTPDIGYGGAGGASRFFKQVGGKVSGEE